MEVLNSLKYSRSHIWHARLSTRTLSDGLWLPQQQYYQRCFTNVPISTKQYLKCLIFLTTCCNFAGPRRQVSRMMRQHRTCGKAAVSWLRHGGLLDPASSVAHGVGHPVVEAHRRRLREQGVFRQHVGGHRVACKQSFAEGSVTYVRREQEMWFT